MQDRLIQGSEQHTVYGKSGLSQRVGRVRDAN